MKRLLSVMPDGRMDALVAERNRKMAASAHAYVRGSIVKFYEWLEASNRPALPDGQSTWICGDCHVGNIGPVASADGRLSIQIRDLDQTVIGNPANVGRAMGDPRRRPRLVRRSRFRFLHQPARSGRLRVDGPLFPGTSHAEGVTAARKAVWGFAQTSHEFRGRAAPDKHSHGRS
jgi:hypothetical protein